MSKSASEYLVDSKVYKVCWLSMVISKNDFRSHVFELRQRISFLVMVLVACCCFGIHTAATQ